MPRHIEIMHRRILGQSQSDIAKDMGMSNMQLSIICNSPLFLLEYHRMVAKRSEKVFEIQDTLLEAAAAGAQLHRDILTPPAGGVDQPTMIKQKSASDVLKMVSGMVRITKQQDEPDESDLPYEERLREVRITEHERVYKGGVATSVPGPDHPDPDPGVNPEIEQVLASEYPPESALPSDQEVVEEELEGDQEDEFDEEDELEPGVEEADPK
jgi:hypothetical protein